MTTAHLIAGALVAVLGLAMAVVAAGQHKLAARGAAAWLADDLGPAAVVNVDRTAGSLYDRLVQPVVAALGRRIAAMAPSARLDRVHDDLLRAGIATRLRAEEVLAVNVLTAGVSIILAVAWAITAHPPARLAIAGCAAVSIAGVALPQAWLRRKIAARREAIFKDLPDALDLMVIGMEAGVTFDGALQVVTDHLDSPLGQELGRTLAEMELGLSRRDALQNLKRRVDVPELTTVVVALLQADALGMSVSRVLRVQSTEMRAKRRQWAREKAGKLPVKILFPLVAFIFPPVMVVILGPAFGDIRHLFG
jgi:tight adherence protein C